MQAELGHAGVIHCNHIPRRILLSMRLCLSCKSAIALISCHIGQIGLNKVTAAVRGGRTSDRSSGSERARGLGHRRQRLCTFAAVKLGRDERLG